MPRVRWNADESLGILYVVLIIFANLLLNNIKLWIAGNIKQAYYILKWNASEKKEVHNFRTSGPFWEMLPQEE